MGNGGSSNRDQLCSCLWDTGATSKGQHLIKRKKIRPLLCDLEKDFKAVADKHGKVNGEHLALLWRHAAERKVGTLTDAEIKLLNQSSKIYLETMDIDHDDAIDFQEFSTWMLGDYKEHAVLSRMRKSLVESGDQTDLTVLKETVNMFQRWDINGNGFVTKAEFGDHLEELARFAYSDDTRTPRELQESAKAVYTHIMEQVEATPDGMIDLWEVLAHALGRRQTPVELLLYDVTAGASAKFSPYLLGRKFEAIYHSAVLVFGSEYWYGGEIFRTVPPNTDLFGPPMTNSEIGMKRSAYKKDLFVVPLGYTLATMYEFHTYLKHEMMPKYTGYNYDVLTHNCNNFSHDAVQFLSGTGIPSEVQDLPEMVMARPTVKLMRPFLNRWLGGFGKEDGTSGQLQRDSHCKVEKPKEFKLLSGDLVHVDLRDQAGATDGEAEVLATILSQDKLTIDIRYFDVYAEEFVTLPRVSKSRVTKTEKDSPRDNPVFSLGEPPYSATLTQKASTTTRPAGSLAAKELKYIDKGN